MLGIICSFVSGLLCAFSGASEKTAFLAFLSPSLFFFILKKTPEKSAKPSFFYGHIIGCGASLSISAYFNPLFHYSTRARISFLAYFKQVVKGSQTKILESIDFTDKTRASRGVRFPYELLIRKNSPTRRSVEDKCFQCFFIFLFLISYNVFPVISYCLNVTKLLQSICA